MVDPNQLAVYNRIQDSFDKLLQAWIDKAYEKTPAVFPAVVALAYLAGSQTARELIRDVPE